MQFSSKYLSTAIVHLQTSQKENELIALTEFPIPEILWKLEWKIPSESNHIERNAFHRFFIASDLLYLLGAQNRVHFLHWLRDSGGVRSNHTSADQIFESAVHDTVADLFHVHFAMRDSIAEWGHLCVYPGIKCDKRRIDDHYRVWCEFGVCACNINGIDSRGHRLFSYNRENYTLLFRMVSNNLAVSSIFTQCTEDAAILFELCLSACYHNIFEHAAPFKRRRNNQFKRPKRSSKSSATKAHKSSQRHVIVERTKITVENSSHVKHILLTINSNCFIHTTKHSCD